MPSLLLGLVLQIAPQTVGLAELTEIDASRAGRSFELLVWYPAEAGGTPATLQEYGAATGSVSPWEPVARRDGRPVDGQRPLVLYVPMPLEEPGHNWRLMEKLASRGYLVASYSPYGIRPGFMDVTAIDLQEQVRDVEFLVSRLRQRFDIAPRGPVIIGHSWGGLVAVATQLRSLPSAVISLDGSEEYWRDVLESLPSFDLSRLRAPYLRVRRPDSVDFGLFAAATFAPRYSYEVAQLTHSELATTPLLRSTDPDKVREFEILVTVIERFIDGVSAGAEGDLFASDLGATFRSGDQPPPTEEELLSLFLSRGLEGTLTRIDEIAAGNKAPAAEKALTRFSEQLMWTLRYPEQAETLLLRLLELYPGSALLFEHLGNLYWMAGDEEQAAAAFERALALDGDNPRLHENLSELRRDHPDRVP